MQASDVSIRKFKPSDIQRIREIAWETSFPGASFHRTRIDKNLLADLLTLYYTSFEPESLFVSEIDGKVAGYIMGSLNPDRFRKKTALIFFTRIAPGLLLGRYKGIFKTLFFLPPIVLGLMKGERDPEITNEYPAHLHINIGEEYQRAGLGSRLMSTLLQHMTAEGVKGVHLSTVSVNEKSRPFFEKWGFRLFCRYKSTFWSSVSGRPAYVEIFVRKISVERV